MQWAVFTFMAVLAIGIASAFFVFLWKRSWVFYPPSDFPGVSLHDYVSAMKTESYTSLVRDDVVQVIESVFHRLGNAEQIKTAAQLGSPGERQVAFGHILAELRKEAEQSVKRAFVRVDARPLLGANGLVWDEIYSKDMLVHRFLDKLWIRLQPIPPYSYGLSWVLRDRESGKTYRDLGRAWAQNEEQMEDCRPLGSVDIKPGTTLEVTAP